MLCFHILFSCSRSKYVHNIKLTNLTSNSLGNQIATCSENGKIQLWNFKVRNLEIFLIINAYNIQ